MQFFLLPSIFEMFFYTSDKYRGPFKGHCGSHLVWSWEQGLGPKTCSMDHCKKSFGLPVASQPTLSLHITNLGLWPREDNTKQRFIIKKMLFLFTCLTFVFAQKKLHEYSENDSFFTIFFKRQIRHICMLSRANVLICKKKKSKKITQLHNILAG